MVDYEDPVEGISPTTAGALVALIAVLGIGLYALSVMIDYKSPDPLYDRDILENHTSSKVMETPDLWKKKELPPLEDRYSTKTPTTNPIEP